MRANLYLFKKDISPKNLPIFYSKTDRENFFSDNSAGKIYENISYNGTRNIRLNVNALSANLDYYNYAKIVWNDEDNVQHEYFCFIDTVIFVNDNVSEIQMTLDYVTTYYFDMKFNEYNLLQTSIKNNMFQRREISGEDTTRFYFENLYPCEYYAYDKKNLEIEVNDLPEKYSVKWCLINVSFNSTEEYDYLYVNTATKCKVILFPLLYSKSSDKFIKNLFGVYYNDSQTIKYYSIESILTQYDGKILNISIIDNPFNNVYYKTTQETPAINSINLYPKSSKNMPVFVINENFMSTNCKIKIQPNTETDFPFVYLKSTINSTILNLVSFSAKAIEKYKYIKIIRNGNEELLSFSQNDFNISKQTGTTISLTFTIDPISPNNIKLNFITSFDDDPFNKTIKCVIIPAPVSNIQFDQSKWAEYYIQNSASVDDGLSTKHKYDMEQVELQRNSAQIQAAISAGGNAVAGIASFATGNAAGGISKLASGITSVANSMVATEYAYQIAENNIDKENALLQISWNDIKSRPNTMYNYGSGTNILTYIDKGITLYFYKPVLAHRNDLRNYHMQYGYKVNRKFSANSYDNFKNLNDVLMDYEDTTYTIKDINYKFIRIESDFVIDNIPITARKMLKEIFKDGIKFYNKENLLIISNENYNNYIEDF